MNDGPVSLSRNCIFCVVHIDEILLGHTGSLYRPKWCKARTKKDRDIWCLKSREEESNIEQGVIKYPPWPVMSQLHAPVLEYRVVHIQFSNSIESSICSIYKEKHRIIRSSHAVRL